MLKVTNTPQSFLIRVIAWYLRDFPVHRGKGIVNSVLGKFLYVKVHHGIRIRILNPLEYHQRALLESRVYEPYVTLLFDALVRPGMTVVDIGANLGYFTLLASFLVGDTGCVHAFEPSHEQFKHLELDIGLNRVMNVVLNNCAVAEASGEREFFLREGWNSGIHSLAKPRGAAGTYHVTCTCIDDYLTSKAIDRIDLLKVDIEGAELLMLRGACKMLAQSPPRAIIFEACEEHAQAFGHSTCDVKRFLTNYGYRVYRFESLSTFCEVADSTKEVFSNLIAIHSSAHAVEEQIAQLLKKNEVTT